MATTKVYGSFKPKTNRLSNSYKKNMEEILARDDLSNYDKYIMLRKYELYNKIDLERKKVLRNHSLGDSNIRHLNKGSMPHKIRKDLDALFDKNIMSLKNKIGRSGTELNDDKIIKQLRNNLNEIYTLYTSLNSGQRMSLLNNKLEATVFNDIISMFFGQKSKLQQKRIKYIVKQMHNINVIHNELLSGSDANTTRQLTMYYNDVSFTLSKTIDKVITYKDIKKARDAIQLYKKNILAMMNQPRVQIRNQNMPIVSGRVQYAANRNLERMGSKYNSGNNKNRVHVGINNSKMFEKLGGKNIKPPSNA